MTVIEYCLTKTEVHELVIIRSGGYRTCAAFIDYEDLFRLPPDIANAEVMDAGHGFIAVAGPANTSCNTPCVYLDIK